MSNTETHFGKLRKVELTTTIEGWCKEQLNKKYINKELSSYFGDTWREAFMNDNNENYFIINDEIWEAFDHIEKSDYDDIDIMYPNEDGSITFVMQFYNGGTCLSEVIEEGLLKIKK